MALKKLSHFIPVNGNTDRSDALRDNRQAEVASVAGWLTELADAAARLKWNKGKHSIKVWQSFKKQLHADGWLINASPGLNEANLHQSTITVNLTENRSEKTQCVNRLIHAFALVNCIVSSLKIQIIIFLDNKHIDSLIYLLARVQRRTNTVWKIF